MWDCFFNISINGHILCCYYTKDQKYGHVQTGASFWILYLILSIFLIGMGVYLWYKEKHWDEEKSRKDLKPPIIG